MPAFNVYSHFDPTSIFAGDTPLYDQRATLPSGLNVAGSPLQPGTLLGLKQPGYSYTVASAAKGGNTGNGTLAVGSPSTLANVMPGVYRVVFTSATAYQVYDPKGDEIGFGSNGAAFGTQVKFTTTAGGTPFAANDEFDLTVTQGGAVLYTAASAANGGNTGNGTLALASPSYVGGETAGGVYTLTMTSPTAFVINDPLGNPVGTGTVGTAFSNQISFTLSQGGTPFAAADGFQITVSAQALFIPCVKTATDGSQYPRAVLVEETDTSGGAANTRVYLQGEFAYEMLTIDASWLSVQEIQNALLFSNNTDLFIRSVGATA